MNERILELLDESGLLKYTKIVVPEYEKFAELIVKDCINVLHEKGMWSVHDSHVLSKHFGVEE